MRTEHLSRVVDGKRLVDDVSLEVQAGDLISIVGPSGAGKSSFLRLLNRLDEPTEGTVFLEGEDYRNIPPRALRRQVGMLMQAPNLFKGTVADNIRFGPRQRGEELSSEAVDRLLRGVNLAGYAGRDVGSLSGGEAQRVSLARTLANSPAMLLLDEPTSSLDEATRRDVEELILQIIDEQALTCLIVTHDQDQARRIARQAAVMETGRLVRFGPIEEVLGA
ncbi:MAG: phosphate ABC transporter ATP-binding protein [Anaerolineae bacterium]